MSGFAFSHQFSHRWLNTPDVVKQTIVQELNDIVTLLQPTTDLDNFNFRVTNLHDAVESLMEVERIRLQAEREEQQRLEQERLEQERLEQERLEAQKREATRLEQERLEKERAEQEKQARLEAEALEIARLEQDRIEIEQLENDYNIAKKSAKKQASTVILSEETPTATSVENQPAEIAGISETLPVTQGTEAVTRHPSEIVYAINDASEVFADNHDAQIAIEETKTHEQPTEVLVKTLATDSTPSLEAIKQQIISELQVHIEKYLQESMGLLQADLNTWLHEEVDRQLAQHTQVNNAPLAD